MTTKYIRLCRNDFLALKLFFNKSYDGILVDLVMSKETRAFRVERTRLEDGKPLGYDEDTLIVYDFLKIGNYLITSFEKGYNKKETFENFLKKMTYKYLMDFSIENNISYRNLYKEIA